MQVKRSVAAGLVLLALGFVTSSGMAASHGEVVEVEIVEDGGDAPFAFEDEEITIEPGTTVRWVHTHDVRHTVTSTDSLEDKQPDGVFDVELDAEGQIFEHTFEEPGTYHYYCKPHSSFMEGTIHVEAGGDGAASEAPLGGVLALLSVVFAAGLSRRG